MADPTSSPAEYTPGQIAAALRHFDTPSVVNAIETFGVRLRNEGYIERGLACMLPDLPAAVGYAFTLRVRSASPPPLGQVSYVDRTDWWEELERIPKPRILVVEDTDVHPGTGAFIGGVHAEILCALGCIAVITNGAVRDLPQAAAIGFQLFARQLSVSHAYVHVVASGEPVKLDGLHILPGDLLHGDRHGVVHIPMEIAHQIPQVVAELRRREREIVRYCRSKGFSPAGLRELLQRAAPQP
jgi:regulator of RNase E activity RraA